PLPTSNVKVVCSPVLSSPDVDVEPEVSPADASPPGPPVAAEVSSEPNSELESSPPHAARSAKPSSPLESHPPIVHDCMAKAGGGSRGRLSAHLRERRWTDALSYTSSYVGPPSCGRW